MKTALLFAAAFTLCIGTGAPAKAEDPAPSTKSGENVAQSNETAYFPLAVYRSGPYASGGAPNYSGMIDYFNLVNMNGGINGVKIVWEECETEYSVERGVECYHRLVDGRKAVMFDPHSTGIMDALLQQAAHDKITIFKTGGG